MKGEITDEPFKVRKTETTESFDSNIIKGGTFR